MKVLFASSESQAFMKVGGLGDVVASLPKALSKMGVECSVIIPLYKGIKQKYPDLKKIDDFYISLGFRHQYVGLHQKKVGDVMYYFVDNEQYFDRDTIYGHFDDGERFTFFSKAIVEVIARHFRDYDIVHCHDWETAMVIPLLREYQLTQKTVFTIHNLRFQGVFDFDMVFDMLGLPYYYNSEDKMAYYGKANYVKAGIVFADKVTTVSPTYANEIQNDYFGENLDGLIRKYNNKIVGILNGIDYDVYDPKKDKYLSSSYDKNNLKNKYKNKLAFQKEMALPQDKDTIMVGMVSRLTDQKGLDLINAVLGEILQMRLQLVILGTGDPIYEDSFRNSEYANHDKMRAIIKYDDRIASEIYAASDIYLMPSQFEPCGLSQMIAMRYGSIPLVRKTGGLNDSVVPYNKFTGEGSGFAFGNYNAHEMLFTLQDAVRIYYDEKDVFNNLIKNAMQQDFSWKVSSQKYLDVYKSLL